MSQFTAKFERFWSMANMGMAHRWAIKEKCKQAIEKLEALAMCMPDNKEELREEIVDWVVCFDEAMGAWLAAQEEADTLQISAEPLNNDTTRIMDAEWVQAGWKERIQDIEDKDAGVKEKPTAMQDSAVKVNKVEEVVAPTVEKGDRSSRAVLVVSSGVKVGCLVMGGRTSVPRKKAMVSVVVPTQLLRTAEGQPKIAARRIVDLDWESEIEEKVVSEGGESEVEFIEASTSKAKGKVRGKVSTEKGKVKAPVKKTDDRRIPNRLALEVEHEGLLVEVSEIVEQLDIEDL
ncbi:hypothetical protein OG21DRAFT_1528097 [Imleria badia]|nr:hypothetical protein OG21DRAFT_1528097 [Imleria badia]